MTCRWCDNVHPVSELCRARRVSRRVFCFALGAAAVAAALPGAARRTTVEYALKLTDTGHSSLWVHEGDGIWSMIGSVTKVQWNKQFTTLDMTLQSGERYGFDRRCLAPGQMSIQTRWQSVREAEPS